MELEHLPIEILSYILKYLNLADRREFALVCRKFYEASLDPNLYWNSTYVFDAQALLPADEHNFDEASFYCKSPNLFISGLSENINVKSLINPPNGYASILGPHVRRLSLKGSSLLDGSFVEILRICESLEGLDITGCKDLFLTGHFLQQPERRYAAARVLKTITDLNLASIRYLNDDCLKTIASLCPLLASLSLASCNILFSEFGSRQSNSLTFPCVVEVVKLLSSTLVRIDLSRSGITNSALKQLANVEGLNLKEVILQNCKALGDTGVITLAKNQPRMHVLDVRGCSEIGDPALSAICTCISNLRELYVAKCRRMGDTSASRISHLDKLQVLDISECYDVAKCIPTILSSLPSLIALIANGCNFARFQQNMSTNMIRSTEMYSVTLKSSSSMQTAFESLTKLSINSGKYVSDLTVQSIFTHLINLEHLSLSWCHYITDRGLVGIEIDSSEDQLFANNEKAEGEFVSTRRYSTSHGRVGFFSSPGSEFVAIPVDWSEVDASLCLRSRGIGRLRRLKRLALSNCRHVTDESLMRIFCVDVPLFPQMEHLELNMMRKSVTDDVLNGISIGCPFLTNLAVSCSSATDDGVASITQRLRRLEVLDLSNCDGITPKFFAALKKNTKWLRELDISSCKHIPSSSAEQLRKSFPLLTRIHTRYSGV